MGASPSDGYTGGQAWMDFLALHYGFWYNGSYRYGVMDGQGANEYVVMTALNAYNNNSYYGIVNTTSTSDLVGKTKYDISVDGRPLDYFANAQYLPEWHVSYQLNHSIEVYALDQKGNYPQYNVDQIYYADTASSADGSGIAGDWSTSVNNMWNNVLETSAAHGDITW